MKKVPFFGAAVLIAASVTAAAGGSPRYDHVVVVVEENHDVSQVMGSPYFAELASRGASFADLHGVTHPSEPNYLALFSGSTQGVTDDAPHDFSAPNLATRLADAGLTFAVYSEGLPAPGSRVVASGRYVRKHNPAASFTNVPASMNLPFSLFPRDFTRLPTVSFVIPDLSHDMHDGSVAAGDEWLRRNLDAYARWAADHASLLVVTFDEGTGRAPAEATPLATLLVGAGITHAIINQPATLYSLLRMIEELYGLPAIAEEKTAPPITGAWE